MAALRRYQAYHRQPLDARILFVQLQRTDEEAEVVAVDIHRPEQGCHHPALHLGVGLHARFYPPAGLARLEIELGLPCALQLLVATSHAL